MMTFLMILASLAVFAATLLGSKEVMICEALRVIAGKWFPWIWLAGAALVLGLTMVLLDVGVKRWNRSILARLRELTITHPERIFC